MRTFEFNDTFVRTYTVSKSDEPGAPSVEVTCTFKLAPDLTADGLMNKALRSDIIRMQAKARSAWNREKDPVMPATNTTALIENVERKSADPNKKARELIAPLLGIKPDEVTDKQIEECKGFILGMKNHSN